MPCATVLRHGARQKQVERDLAHAKRAAPGAKQLPVAEGERTPTGADTGRLEDDEALCQCESGR